MMLQKLVTTVKDENKNQLKNLNEYIDFCKRFLEYKSKHIQATIISQNENNYCFYQYKDDGHLQITRPINSNLMYSDNDFDSFSKEFIYILSSIKDLNKNDNSLREIINRTTYTIQQSIGCVLDALPVGQSQIARKRNGQLFENLILILINSVGIPCRSGTMQIPVIVDGEPTFNMSYQHDLIVEKDDQIKLIGSVKTSSKDRIDKIFIDKFLYNSLTEKNTPHIAIFLNDVQRKKTKTENKFGINSTFLPGHFKGYTVKINPLDGVYYCDIRPNMKTESILKDHIKTFDNLLMEDIWKLVD